MPPAEARREIERAIATAQAEDRRLRGRVAALVHDRVGAAAVVEAATAEADEAWTLAKRALRQADDAARVGQRADTARWTSAAEVFAKRLADARARVVEAERQIAAAGPELDRLRTALDENVGRVQAVAAARIPMLSGRKSTKAQRLVDVEVTGLTAPVDDVVARAERDARAVLEAAEPSEADDDVVVDDDDLERELDDAGVDDILHELRVELGLVVDADETAADDVVADDVVPEDVDPASDEAVDADGGADDGGAPDDGASDDGASDDGDRVEHASSASA